LSEHTERLVLGPPFSFPERDVVNFEQLMVKCSVISVLIGTLPIPNQIYEQPTNIMVRSNKSV
jgi:hypothetical protein